MWISNKKNKSNNATSSSFCGLFFYFCLLFSFLLSGCAPKQVDETAYVEPIVITQNVEPVVEVDPRSELEKMEHYSGLNYYDLEKTELSDIQKQILLTTTELEKGLSKEQMLEVLEFYVYFLEREEMLEVFYGRSVPYHEYVVDIFRDHGLPEDIACLAFIESGYNIKAKSSAGATGLWQFMPKTGRQYGLKQDWWGDWRHDPYQSTQAAAEHLTHLYGRFDDWLLAISAYNAGEGKINRALKGTGTKTLHDLVQSNGMLSRSNRLRTETLEYVPRLIAMAKIMNNADDLGLEPQAQKNSQPHTKIHSTLVKNNTDLLAVSKALGMSWTEFHLYNPALSSYVSPGDRFIYIHVPEAKAELVSQALAKTSKTSGYYAYTVRRNDSFSKISQNSKVPVSVLQHVNPVRILKINSVVYIPLQPGKSLPKAITSPAPVKSTRVVAQAEKTPTPSTRELKTTAIHRVESGDTFYGIADKYKVSVNQIYALNKNVKADSLKLGTILRLPEGTNSKMVASEYVVKRGDTLWDISQSENISTTRIREYNNLTSSSLLQVGQVLVLPSANTSFEEDIPATQRITKVATRATTSLSEVIEDAFITEYVIQPGDTLWDISREIEVSTDTIMELNNIKSASSIKVGQVLKLPQPVVEPTEQVAMTNPQEYVVQSGDTLWGISRKINISTSEIMELNNLSDGASIKAGQTLLLP